MNNYLRIFNIKIVKILLFLFWFILFAATSFPGKPGFNIGVQDKVAHFGGYFILSFLLYWYLFLKNKIEPGKKKICLFTITIMFSYSIFDEVHQLFIPGRSFELLDLFADLIGLLSGTFLSKYIFSRINNWTEN